MSLKPGPERLARFVGHWPTDKGTWIPGEAVKFRDKSLFDDFGDQSWMALLIYGIRGELPEPRVATLMEQIWIICTSFPDPRLWNNRVGALAGTARTTGALGLAAATAVSEASIYGRRPDIIGFEFLVDTRRRVEAGADLEELVMGYLQRHRVVPGFGRPVVSRDERVEPLLSKAAELELDGGVHLELVGRIEAVLQRRRLRMQANIASYCAALLADLGFTPREYYNTVLLSFTAGIMPCYLDAVEKPEGVFFPLACNNIEYRGPAKRRLDNEA